MALPDDWIERRMEEIRTLGRVYAKAKAEKDHLEEFKKSKLALLMKEYESRGVKAANAQEREARADKEYIDLLAGLKVATEEAEAARWDLKNVELSIEVWRTNESTKRAERQGYRA